MAARIDGNGDRWIGCAGQLRRLRQVNGNTRRKDQGRAKHEHDRKQKRDTQERRQFQLAAKRFDAARKSHAVRPLGESQTMFTISPAAFSMSRTMAFTRLTR